MSKYYKIGEVAKLYGISIDTLRYYEESGLIKPIRGDNGYRYYKIAHIQKLNTIRELREIGFSVAEITKHLQSFQINDTIALLDKQVERIDEKTQNLLELKERLLLRSKNLKNNQKLLNESGIKIKEIPDRKVLLLNDEIKQYQDIDFSLKKLQYKHNKANLVLSDCSLGAIASLDRVLDNEYGEYLSVFYILESKTAKYDKIIQGGTYISLIHKGSYEDIGPKTVKLIDEAKQRGYKAIGDPVELYIIDEYDTGMEDEFLTEIQIPISI